jgi:hypothetical protein
MSIDTRGTITRSVVHRLPSPISAAEFASTFTKNPEFAFVGKKPLLHAFSDLWVGQFGCGKTSLFSLLHDCGHIFFAVDRVSQRELLGEVSQSVAGRHLVSILEFTFSKAQSLLEKAKETRKLLRKLFRCVIARKVSPRRKPSESIDAESQMEKLWPLLMIFKNH